MLPLIVFADNYTVDADLVASGNQNTVSLTALPGAAVSTSGTIVWQYQGNKHLVANGDITFVVAGDGQTTLPPGYTVGSVPLNTGSTWADGSAVSGASDVSFTAPAIAGVYSYTVKWEPSSYTCEVGTKPVGGCVTGAAALTITLTVVDPTPPVIEPVVSGTPGNNGWYTSDVTVTWTITDGESAVTSTSGCDAVTITADTAGTTLTCTATSSGGTASASVTVKRDATAPVATASPTPAPNVNGWNNTNVTVTFGGTDSTSGIDSCSTPVTLNTDGAEQSVSGTCTDLAGNVSAPAVASGINIDKTAPVVMVTGITGGAIYTVGGVVPAAGCDTTDGLSGVATAVTVTVSGGNANGVGTFTVTCAGAVDVAGNPQGSAVTAQYTVTYAFCGFKQPLLVPVQTYKLGSTIPVKYCVKDANGNSVATAEGVVSADNAVQGTARYDATDQQYIFNLRTKGLTVGPLLIVVTLDDGTPHLIEVALK